MQGRTSRLCSTLLPPPRPMRHRCPRRRDRAGSRCLTRDRVSLLPLTSGTVSAIVTVAPDHWNAVLADLAPGNEQLEVCSFRGAPPGGRSHGVDLLTRNSPEEALRQARRRVLIPASSRTGSGDPGRSGRRRHSSAPHSTRRADHPDDAIGRTQVGPTAQCSRRVIVLGHSMLSAHQGGRQWG
jgi:hypothetical protein